MAEATRCLGGSATFRLGQTRQTASDRLQYDIMAGSIRRQLNSHLISHTWNRAAMAVGNDAHASDRQDAVVLFRSGWQHYQKARDHVHPVPSKLPAAASGSQYHSEACAANASVDGLCRTGAGALAPPGSSVSCASRPGGLKPSLAASASFIIVRHTAMLQHSFHGDARLTGPLLPQALGACTYLGGRACTPCNRLVPCRVSGAGPVSADSGE